MTSSTPTEVQVSGRMDVEALGLRKEFLRFVDRPLFALTQWGIQNTRVLRSLPDFQKPIDRGSHDVELHQADDPDDLHVARHSRVADGVDNVKEHKPED